MELMSPKYRLNLIKQIKKAIEKLCRYVDDEYLYIKQWRHCTFCDYESGRTAYNFDFEYFDNGYINTLLTLGNINDETLIKIAIDLGIDTPDFIPSIPTFRNTIKDEYPTASATFEQAYKKIETEPEIAIGLANSTLESIVKEMLKDDRIKVQWNEKYSLYKLTKSLLKGFKFHEVDGIPEEIKSIGSSLAAIAQGIEDLRSDKTCFHGKTNDDYVIKDPMYAYFVVNSVCTVGMFLKSFYDKHYPKQQVVESNELAIDWDNLPF